MEIGSITPPMSQMTMQAVAASMEKTVRSVLSASDWDDVIIQIRLKKRFFGADEIIGDFMGPPDILRRLKSAD